MHMQARVVSDVGRQSCEQSPLLTLQGLVPSWSGGEWEAQRKGYWFSSGPRHQAGACLGTGWSPLDPRPCGGLHPYPELRAPVLQGPWPL